MPQIEFPDIGATIEVDDNTSPDEIQGIYDQLSQGRFSSAVQRGLKTLQSDTGSSIASAGRASVMARNAASGATARQIAMQSAMSGGDIPANLPRSTPQTRTADLEESTAYQLGKDIQDRAEETFRTNPRYADSAAETLASGLGSVAALAPSALAGPAGPLAAGAAYGLNAGERAYQEAIDTVDRRIAEAMAAGDAATAERLERDKGRLAENAYLKNVPIGAGTEAAMGVAGRLVPLGRGRTLGKSFDQGLERVVPRSINPVARAATKSGVEGAVREGVQETAEQGLQNLAALEYDPDRAFTEGMIQSGAGGAGVGFIVGGGAGAANRVNRQMRVKEWRDSRRADKTGATAPVEEPPLAGETEADRAAQAIVDGVAPVLPESAAALETVVAQAEAAPVVEPETVVETPVAEETQTVEPEETVEPTPTVEESSVVAAEPGVAPEVAVTPPETAVTTPEVSPEPTAAPQPDASVFEALTSDEFLNALDDYGSAEGPPLGAGVADKWVKAVETVKTGSLPVEEIQKGINEAWITTDGRVLTLHVEGYNNDAELKQDNVSVWVDEDGRVHMMATNAVPRLRSFAINKIFKMLNGKPTTQQAPKRLPAPEPISSDIPTPQATPPTTQPDAPLVEGAAIKAAPKPPWQMTRFEFEPITQKSVFIPDREVNGRREPGHYELVGPKDPRETFAVGDEGVFYRAGTLPKSGFSKDYRDNITLAGVSVYPTPVPNSFAGLKKADWYVGMGKVVGIGPDGEPLIKPLGKWEKFSKKDSSDRVGDAHKFHVKKAILTGVDVPSNVIAEYPDLQLKPNGAPTPQPPPRSTGKPGQYAEPSTPAADIFDPLLTDEQIADFFRSDTPASGLLARGSRLTFATYDEFRDWMDARFAENDLEGISAGLKDSDSAMKVRYIKSTRSGDPIKRDVISHLATGSPIPAGWTPTPRTTPRPNPPSMGGTSAPPPPARPAQPPPPPRMPTNRTGFSIPALVQLLRMFGKYPRIDRTLKGAYGRYGQGSQQVELKGRLLWDRDLATNVLSHEIGHFIDLAIEKFGKGKQFANRWQPLLLFKKKLAEKQALLAAAKSLSRDWRGPFSADDQYRNDVKELFADALSAILTDPEWVNKRHPLIHDTFQDLLKGKPAFQRAYNTVTDWLRGGEIPKVASRQLSQAMRESRRKLALGIKLKGMTPWDMFQGKLIDPFFRAQQIEGNPGTLGTRTIDRLGRLRSMPAMMAALLKDDWLKTVQPALNKIKGGGEAARDVFGKYLTANRVVNERRASGAWIEQNPTEALEVMRKITESNPLLSSWRGELAKLGDAPSGPALYDFAAEMFREVHDKGEDAVKSVADSINDLDLGLDGDAALMAFNVRGKLLNPSGIDVSTAQQMLTDIDNDLTPDERTALQDAASALFEINHKVMEAMRDMGLISPRAWKEIVEPNRNNYVPFAVADYWQGTVGAGMKPQWGTAKDIIDPVVALQQKLGASFRWMQKQAQVQALIQAYANAGYDVTQTAKRLQFASDVSKLRAKHLKDDTSVLLWWKNGVPYAIELHDDPGHSFETAVERPMDYTDVARVLNSGWLGGLTRANRALLALYTTFSGSFLSYRNPIRDFKTTAQHIGYARVARALATKDHITPLARNYAAAGFGNTPMLPEVRKLVEMGVLPPPSSHHLVANTPEEVEQMLLDGRLLANEVKLQRDGVIPSRFGRFVKAPIEAIEQLGALQEAGSKILAYRAAKLRPGMSDERATELARRSGIPLPGIGGTSMWIIDMVYSWSRVTVQGLRGTIDILKDPELGKEMRGRIIALEIIPRLVKYSFASGLVGMATGGSGGDDDDGLAGTIGEFYRRVSPYKVAIDMVTPLAWFDTRTGKYIPIYKTFNMKASQIPKYYEAVGWRRPSSEEGKLWGSMVYSALAGITPDKTGKGGQGVVAGLADWLKTTATPGYAPIIKYGVMIGSMIAGKNPEDEFRGQPMKNRDMHEAGGIPSFQAGIGALLNQAGDAGAVAALALESMGLLPEEATKNAKSFAGRMQSAISKTPVLKGVISHDNYADYRDETVAKKDELRYRSQVKLLMTPEIREMYDYYNANSQRTDKLDSHERSLFNIASQWHNEVYGSASEVGTVANKAIAAIKKQEAAPMLDRAANFMNGNDSRFKASVKQELIDRSRVDLMRFSDAKKRP